MAFRTDGRQRRSCWRRQLSVTALAALAAIGTTISFAHAQALTDVKISVDYTLYGPNSPIYYAEASGLFREAGIKAQVDSSKGSGDAINRVASGAYDAAYADLGTLAEFWARHPDSAPKMVMVILDRSPQSIVSLKDKHITKIGDLVGHVVGTGHSDGAARMFSPILKINHVDEKKLTRKVVDQKIRDAMLARNDVDAVTGYDFAIMFNLKSLGKKMSDANIIYYADNGFNFYANGLVVSRDLIAKKPELVRKLARAVAKAWVKSISDPEAVIAALANRDPLTKVPLEIERLKWVNEKDVVTAATRKGGLGYVDPEKLNHGLKILAEGFELKKVPTMADVYDGRFLPSLEDRRIPAN
jgi:NitT/TauT family transport system substrate-binding protein